MVKRNLNLTDFVYLLLITLAKKNLLIDIRNRKIKTAVIPLDYKEVIEEILCQGNGWCEEFSILIDIDEYFKDHFSWEKKFTKELNDTVSKLGKRMEYDLEFDRIIIKFTDEELEKLMHTNNMLNEELSAVIEHFANLFNSFIFTRKYREEFISHINITYRNVSEINKHSNNDNRNKDDESNLLIRIRRMK